MSIKAKIGRAIRRKGSVEQRAYTPLSTKVVHCKRESYDVYIGRPTKWGNPFVIGPDGSRATVLEKYFRWIYADDQKSLREDARAELRGKRLGCFCSPQKCHGDILAIISESIEEIEC